MATWIMLWSRSSEMSSDKTSFLHTGGRVSRSVILTSMSFMSCVYTSIELGDPT